MSPLMIATKNNYFEIVEMLLKITNINLNIKNKVKYFKYYIIWSY